MDYFLGVNARGRRLTMAKEEQIKELAYAIWK
jgi:hypothetical protein